MALLEIENLSVKFPTKTAVMHAVDGVSLSLVPGRTLALVGESGCGKTTMAKAVTRGDIFVTTTGNEYVITEKHMDAMKHRAIVCNGDRPVHAQRHRPIGVEQGTQRLAGHPQPVVERCGDDGSCGGERSKAAIGSIGRHRTNILHSHAVDLADLGDQQVDEAGIGQVDGELVDRAAATTFEDVDADHDTVRRADTTRNLPQRARTIGQPDSNDERLHRQRP